LDKVIPIEKEDDEHEEFGLSLTKSGGLGAQFKLKRSTTKVEPPRNTEELRAAYTTMGHHWTVVRLRHPNRAELQGLDVRVFEKHLEWLLGEECLGLDAKDAAGRVIASTSWLTLLNYEFELRKYAIKLMNEGGTPLAEGLQQARQNNSLMNRFLIAPLSLNSRGGASSSNDPWQGKRDAGEFQGKGEMLAGARPKKAAKPSPKGKPQAQQQEQAPGVYNAQRRKGEIFKTKTDGDNPKLVCYAYQRPSGCKRPNCNMAHVCCRCLGRHPIQTCRQEPIYKK
jgi:hypothetical protein